MAYTLNVEVNPRQPGRVPAYLNGRARQPGRILADGLGSAIVRFRGYIRSGGSPVSPPQALNVLEQAPPWPKTVYPVQVHIPKVFQVVRVPRSDQGMARRSTRGPITIQFEGIIYYSTPEEYRAKLEEIRAWLQAQDGNPLKLWPGRFLRVYWDGKLVTRPLSPGTTGTAEEIQFTLIGPEGHWVDPDDNLYYFF